MGTEPAAEGRGIRIALQVVAWFNLLSAVGGMLGLLLVDDMLPASLLEGTAFSSYLGPALILGVIVGGPQALALIAQYRRYVLAWGLHAAAGLVMLGWIFVEIALLLFWTPLQGVYFTTGLVQVALAAVALGAWPRPFLRRT